MAVTSSTSSTAAVQNPAGSRVADTSVLENLLALGACLWMVSGLFVDGYAHINIIDTATEDFFTPWHAILYSGFLAATGWIGLLAIRRANTEPWYRWFPAGYGGAAIGAVVFALGGIGDGIWHTIFGIETSLDALLSPSHLLLLAGFLLMVTAPVRAVEPSAHGVGVEPGVATWLAALSLTLAMAVVGFFTAYANTLDSGWLLSMVYNPRTNGNWMAVEFALSGSLFATVCLVASAAYLWNRHRPRFGATVLLWSGPVFFVTSAFGGSRLAGTVGAAAGGVVVDVILRALAAADDRPRRRHSLPVALAGGVFTVWSVFVLIEHVRPEPVVWLPELWTGLIVINTFLAATLAATTLPARHLVPEPVGATTPRLEDG